METIHKQVRVGVCCDKPDLWVTASKFQTYVECKNCECRCINTGVAEDGEITCWKHHDCSDGSCTHYE